ncbi:unnamed protein product [Nezara viridula]|uniref:EGF-like domain-containing protein n=1 Tax=Nezara viridula TaxID=85310 RepID=A0A9P0E1R5_NEZVI|nr:unnamed protein product [Nezara viridula]
MAKTATLTVRPGLPQPERNGAVSPVSSGCFLCLIASIWNSFVSFCRSFTVCRYLGEIKRRYANCYLPTNLIDENRSSSKLKAHLVRKFLLAPVLAATTTLWPLYGVPCPIANYCLNDGTCTYYETVGELVCQCAEGFKGQRCENKDVYNRSSMYRPKPYTCKLGISSSFYC